MSAGFMGAVLNGHDPREAWDGYRRMILDDPQQRAVVRQLAADPAGRALLDDSRSAWHDRGFVEAPFDFVFEERVGAQELR